MSAASGSKAKWGRGAALPLRCRWKMKFTAKTRRTQRKINDDREIREIRGKKRITMNSSGKASSPVGDGEMHARILIVEDELPMRTGLEDTLAGEGFRVISASDGERGLERAIKEKPDLVLLDVMMPKL